VFYLKQFKTRTANVIKLLDDDDGGGGGRGGGDVDGAKLRI
jgi:hypothetical protein